MENKGKLILIKTGNSSYYPEQTLLSSLLLINNFKIKIYKLILPVELYSCKSWYHIKEGTQAKDI